MCGCAGRRPGRAPPPPRGSTGVVAGRGLRLTHLGSPPVVSCYRPPRPAGLGGRDPSPRGWDLDRFSRRLQAEDSPDPSPSARSSPRAHVLQPVRQEPPSGPAYFGFRRDVPRGDGRHPSVQDGEFPGRGIGNKLKRRRDIVGQTRQPVAVPGGGKRKRFSRCRPFSTDTGLPSPRWVENTTSLQISEASRVKNVSIPWSRLKTFLQHPTVRISTRQLSFNIRETFVRNRYPKL